MKIILAGIGFKNNDIEFNKNRIIEVIKEYSNKGNLILFGESYLQGFDSLSWNFENDKNVAISINSKEINDIKEASRINNIAVSFGYFELDDDLIYSSQIVIDNNGNIIHNYRRVSKGWKEYGTDYHYKEGESFSRFTFNDKEFVIGLCGDLWYESNIIEIDSLKPDIILWPVYTDYNYNMWNESEKYEYAKQVEGLNKPVLYVNSYCLFKEEEIARGGACLFLNGKIEKEIPSGKEDCLVIEID